MRAPARCGCFSSMATTRVRIEQPSRVDRFLDVLGRSAPHELGGTFLRMSS
jgi:hypothetical protein